MALERELMPTMKDVAKRAGVSLGTVSNALNGRASVSEENRKKVMDAVETLNYRPNFIARNLKTNTTKSLGLVIPDISNPYYPELARGVEDTARKFGYSVLLCNNDRSQSKEREYVRILLEKKMDGIILVKPRLEAEEIAETQKLCPLVLVDADYDLRMNIDSIDVDDENAILDALALLYDYHHRRIAFIRGLSDSKSSRKRQEAYRRFLKDKNLPYNEDLVVSGDYNWISGYNCTVELLRGIRPPTAIIAANDLMAIGAMKAVYERGLRIPDDISVLGYDDIEMASVSMPPLTTVRQPKYEIGALSVETMLKRLESKNDFTRQPRQALELKTNIILRGSVGYAHDPQIYKLL